MLRVIDWIHGRRRAEDREEIYPISNAREERRAETGS